jgi:hypothetical protein
MASEWGQANGEEGLSFDCLSRLPRLVCPILENIFRYVLMTFKEMGDLFTIFGEAVNNTGDYGRTPGVFP